MTAITLLTPAGFKFYHMVDQRFYDAKMTKKLDDLKVHLYDERAEAERVVLHFLNDEDLTKTHKMDDNDESGWAIWKEASDKYSVLNYFYNRKQ